MGFYSSKLQNSYPKAFLGFTAGIDGSEILSHLTNQGRKEQAAFLEDMQVYKYLVCSFRNEADTLDREPLKHNDQKVPLKSFLIKVGRLIQVPGRGLESTRNTLEEIGLIFASTLPLKAFRFDG